MKHNSLYEISILVNGKPVTEYAAGDKTFVEGRKSSEYKIRIKNNSYQRIEAVVSVDGLSVMTGKDASSNESGYLVPGYGTVDVPGFRLDGKEVAKFTFSGKDQSYSVQSGKDGSNVGVIGVKIFEEKIYNLPINNIWNDGLFPKTPFIDPYYGGGGIYPFGGGGWSSGISGSIGGAADKTQLFNSILQDKPMMAACSTTNSVMRGMSMNNITETQSVGVTKATETLGTAFGHATDFATTEVSFTRAYSWDTATMVLHYGNRKQLEEAGVVFPKPKKSHKKKEKIEPQAFPGDRCVPPPGWKR